MKKVTQKELKRMVNGGHATDISTHDKVKGLRQIAYSSGVNGCNGMLLEHKDTKQLYAIIGRTTALWLY